MWFLLGGTGLPLSLEQHGLSCWIRGKAGLYFALGQGHLAGAFTPGSPPSSSWRAFTSPAGSPAMTLLPPSPFSGLPLRSPSDPSKEARRLSAE